VPTPVRPKRRRRWLRALGWICLLLALTAGGIFAYFYVTLAKDVDARLSGALDRVEPRVFARPFELRAGQQISTDELVDRLNDLGYAERAVVDAPGEFTLTGRTVSLIARSGPLADKTIRVSFTPPPVQPAKATKRPPPPDQITRLDVTGAGTVPAVTVDAPLLSAIATGAREKRRRVPIDRIPRLMREAVLAIEDRRFYDHPGVDVIRTIGAVITNLRGDKPYLVGGSTLTQQLVKNSFLTRDKTVKRKLQEQMMALILERRLTKDEILEFYLNDVYLGQRGSFAIHGVAEAARLIFGKDVANLTLVEAATIAGMIQSPPAYSPFRFPDRARERRNVVLRAMADSGYITGAQATTAQDEPLTPVARALDAEAPWFVDLITQQFNEAFPGGSREQAAVDIYTTLDLHLQRIAQAALIEGVAKVDEMLAKRRKHPEPAQAALLAVDPRTGDVLAFVGGRSYNQSQFNRVLSARRQPGSVFKPFVYLSAFETAAAEGRTDLTPATIVDDTQTTFYYDDQEWTPGNYGDEYDGPITLRRALALSRNVATAKVAELVGYDRIAALWKQVGTSMQPRPFPSISLGVFEVTPWEVAQTYTLFPNLGEIRPLRTMLRIVDSGKDVAPPAASTPRRIAREDTTFLVLSMMKSVIDEGTGAGARAAGFTLDAAGKSGTTNDLRDAWFVGFTPELLCVVWVGFDDNRAVGLSGSQAALPIWTAFMKRALAGHANVPFVDPPQGITFADIDRDTGMLAGPNCPRVYREAFLYGTEPVSECDQH